MLFRSVLDHVAVIAEQANAINVQLEVGAVSQTVTVSGNSTPLIDTETASVSGTISTNQIQNMPSFGRDVFPDYMKTINVERDAWKTVLKTQGPLLFSGT